MNLNYTIEIDTDRKLVLEKIYGIWKKETAEEYYNEFRESVAPLVGKEWAKLINLCNWKSSYPEIVDVIGEHLKWCRENGMVLSVNVIDNPVTIRQLKRMFTVGGIEDISEICKSQAEAERLLKSRGY